MIIRIVIILLLLPLLFGCAFINEFGATTPRDEDLWTKPNYSKKIVIEALSDCRNKIDWLKSTSEIYNDIQKCMLQAGFIFNDITAGARPLCNDDLFVNTPGCQSMKQRKYGK